MSYPGDSVEIVLKKQTLDKCRTAESTAPLPANTVAGYDVCHLPTSPNSLPLTGVTILDLTRAVAGPFCTMTLADLGARVIKIEEAASGDETRRWGPPFRGSESAYFLSVNRNKESVALNLKEERDKSALLRLAKGADVAIENFRPGVADRLGAGYKDLSAANPGLIYVSISGFGQNGPLRDKPGYDLVAQAMSGLMRVSASPGGDPVKVAFPVADILTALFASQAILAALYQRERGGGGRYIELSLIESLLAAMCPITGSCLMTGREPAPMGTGQANIVPYQMFRCLDGYIVAGAPNERLWRRFAEALGRPDWCEQECYRTNEARMAHRSQLIAEIEGVLGTANASHWIESLERAEVPCGEVLNVSRILEHPQLAARGSIVEMHHPALGTLRNIGYPARFEGITQTYRAAPLLGEHTSDVLAEFDEA